jgi:ribonuclease E
MSSSAAIRDYLRADIGEILIDHPEVYQEAHDFMSSR